MTQSNPSNSSLGLRPLVPSWLVALALTGILATTVWLVWGDDFVARTPRGRFERVEDRAVEPKGPPIETLYQRYAMEPLPNAEAFGKEIDRMLSALAREPCDQRAVGAAEASLKRGGFPRESAKLLIGYAGACPDSIRAVAAAAETLYVLGDFAPALETAERVVRAQPDWAAAHFLVARILQGLGRIDEALEAYAVNIRLIGDLKSVPADTFINMSTLYSALGRHCEAMTPIQTYIAVDPGDRDTPVLRYLIADQAQKGKCDHTYAEGTTKLQRASNGVVLAKAEINGVSGTFAVDTGASFVSVSKSFAARAKLTALQSGRVGLHTANGVAAAALTTVSKIRLGASHADAAPAVILDKPIGHGVDGLLGMSFLARFDIVLTDKELKLVPKPAQPKSLQ